MRKRLDCQVLNNEMRFDMQKKVQLFFGESKLHTTFADVFSRILSDTKTKSGCGAVG